MSRKDAVGTVLQETWDTSVIGMSYWPPVTAETVGAERNVLEIEESIGSYAPTDRVLGGKIWKGMVTGAVRPASLPIFLTQLCGHPTSSGILVADGSCYIHKYYIGTASATNIPHMCCLKTQNVDTDTDIIDLYSNGYMDSLELSVAADDYMMMSADYIFGANACATASAGTVDATSKFTFKDVTARFITDASTSATVNLSNFRVKVGNGLAEKPFRLGSYLTSGINTGNITCEVEFDFLDDPILKYRDTLSDSQSYYTMSCTASGGVEIASGCGAFYKVAVTLDKVRLTTAPVDIDAGTVMNAVTMTGIAVVSGTQVGSIFVQNNASGSLY